MSEWKATGWVFLVLVILAVGVVLYLNREQHISYTYKGCKLEFTYRRRLDTISEQYDATQRAFGKCLCEQYLKKPDTVLAKCILSQASHYGYGIPRDSSGKPLPVKLDTILKNRKAVFDPVILWD